jgi:hypothetical protein
MSEDSREEHTSWWWVEVSNQGQSYIYEKRTRADQHTNWKDAQQFQNDELDTR